MTYIRHQQIRMYQTSKYECTKQANTNAPNEQIYDFMLSWLKNNNESSLNESNNLYEVIKIKYNLNQFDMFQTYYRCAKRKYTYDQMFYILSKRNTYIEAWEDSVKHMNKNDKKESWTKLYNSNSYARYMEI